MDNHLSLGNAPSGTLLSVIIRTDPQKYSFHDSIRDSLRSFRKINHFGLLAFHIAGNTFGTSW